MPKEFVHLHLHTDYSLLDGACAISWDKLKKEDQEGKYDIVKLAKAHEMKAVAITDHGVMGGCLEFHNALKKEGLKPIIGCETYVAPHSRLEKSVEVPYIKGFHLILLAKDDRGYHNLCQLISEAHVSGFYYKPRIDKELLAKYSGGLIGMSACLQGEIDVASRFKGYDAAKKVLGEYLDIFGKDNFYLELMYHGIEDQKKVNRDLIALSRDCGVPLVATNDVHYLRKEDAKSHEIMLCIQTRTTMDDPRRMKMDQEEFYFKSGDEMAEIFGSEVPEALSNTLAIAERCNVTIGYENHYPEYTPPQDFIETLDLSSLHADSEKEIDAEFTALREKKMDTPPPSSQEREAQVERRMILKKAGAYLRKICLDGFRRRFGYDPDHPPAEHAEEAEVLLQRMNYELGVINRMKYNSYFLVVWDFIHTARSKGIPVGPGRGSGPGSLVAYLTGITNIDPIRYGLLFERFLNPDRISPPDFDVDFCERRRGEVIDYVIEKYGFDSVSQIGTYGTLKAKAVLKDVARALSRTPAEGAMITKTVPDDPKMTLAKAVKESPDLRQLLDREPWVRDIFAYSAPIEQLNRQMGIHACGVIICNQPLANLVPLGRGAHDEIITQYVAPLCESIGLLKMDFLGLRTLTVIQDACDNVRKNRGIALDMEQIPLDDKPTYDLLNSGDTVAVFQLESGGMQNLCRKFGVENIKHIIALVAIYRPGPMQFIDLFVGRKKGTIPLEYDHPLMEQYLSETYGIMLYQEQIMQVVQVLAGFSLGQADILRRAIGKKKIKDMEAQHDKFIEGCFKTNQIPAAQAEKIWENIKKFADYGFNKSHSAAYATMSYRTAYLKANYRPEFMAAVLTSELSNAEKLAFLINECRTSGIRILPPDVNRSDVNFTVDRDAIRFGLGAIKGFGQGVSASIIEARKQGPFKSLSDLIERTEGLTSKSIEALIRCGALDSLGLKRSQLMAIIDSSIQSANMRKRDKASGQGNLFDMLSDFEAEGFGDVPPPDIPEFDESEILNDEKTLLGFYVSGHPLSKYSNLISTFSTSSIAQITQMPTDIGVKLGGMIKSVTRKITKQEGKPFAILRLEDLSGSIECIVYNRTYEKCRELLVEDGLVFIEALTKKNDENAPCALMVENVVPLDQVTGKYTKELHIHIYQKEFDVSVFGALQTLLKRNPGPVPVILCLTMENGMVAFVETGREFSVSVTSGLIDSIQHLVGEGHYKLKADDFVPQTRPRYQKAE